MKIEVANDRDVQDNSGIGYDLSNGMGPGPFLVAGCGNCGGVGVGAGGAATAKGAGAVCGDLRGARDHGGGNGLGVLDDPSAGGAAASSGENTDRRRVSGGFAC